MCVFVQRESENGKANVAKCFNKKVNLGEGYMGVLYIILVIFYKLKLLSNEVFTKLFENDGAFC